MLNRLGQQGEGGLCVTGCTKYISWCVGESLQATKTIAPHYLQYCTQSCLWCTYEEPEPFFFFFFLPLSFIPTPFPLSFNGPLSKFD